MCYYSTLSIHQASTQGDNAQTQEGNIFVTSRSIDSSESVKYIVGAPNEVVYCTVSFKPQTNNITGVAIFSNLALFP